MPRRFRNLLPALLCALLWLAPSAGWAQSTPVYDFLYNGSQTTSDAIVGTEGSSGVGVPYMTPYGNNFHFRLVSGQLSFSYNPYDPKDALLLATGGAIGGASMQFQNGHVDTYHTFPSGSETAIWQACRWDQSTITGYLVVIGGPTGSNPAVYVYKFNHGFAGTLGTPVYLAHAVPTNAIIETRVIDSGTSVRITENIYDQASPTTLNESVTIVDDGSSGAGGAAVQSAGYWGIAAGNTSTTRGSIDRIRGYSEPASPPISETLAVYPNPYPGCQIPARTGVATHFTATPTGGSGAGYTQVYQIRPTGSSGSWATATAVTISEAQAGTTFVTGLTPDTSWDLRAAVTDDSGGSGHLSYSNVVTVHTVRDLIGLIGDSITFGTDASATIYAAPSLIEPLLNTGRFNAGTYSFGQPSTLSGTWRPDSTQLGGGDGTVNLLTNACDIGRALGANIWQIQLGTNDVFGAVAPSAFTANLESTIDYIYANTPASKVVLVQPIGGSDAEVRAYFGTQWPLGGFARLNPASGDLAACFPAIVAHYAGVRRVSYNNPGDYASWDETTDPGTTHGVMFTGRNSTIDGLHPNDWGYTRLAIDWASGLLPVLTPPVTNLRSRASSRSRVNN